MWWESESAVSRHGFERGGGVGADAVVCSAKNRLSRLGSTGDGGRRKGDRGGGGAGREEKGRDKCLIFRRLVNLGPKFPARLETKF